MTDTQPTTTATPDAEPDDVALLGVLPVDSGHVLIVDPCHLPDELVAALTSPNEHGVTVGVMAPTLVGDGLFPVIHDEFGLAVDLDSLDGTATDPR